MLEDKIKEIYSDKVKKNNSQDYKNNIKETNDIGNEHYKGNNIKPTKSQLKKKKKKKIVKRKLKIENNYKKSFSKIELKTSNFAVYNNNSINQKKTSTKSIEQNNVKKYNDFELNSFSYEEAIKNDKRGFYFYYISLIKRKHPVIFYFCSFNDYNSIIIKVCLFFLSVSIYYFINTLFFDESTIHKIYEDEGTYNFGYLIPHISYSFLISHCFSFVFKYIFLSERNLYEIKNLKNIDDISDVLHKVKRCLVLKYICFFVLSLIFLIFFWYYLSSFGAVFQNTQIYIVKNTSICYAFALIYPFIINILPSIFRIYSLSDKKRKWVYNISKFLQYI